jgi:hypothetical protein
LKLISKIDVQNELLQKKKKQNYEYIKCKVMEKKKHKMMNILVIFYIINHIFGNSFSLSIHLKIFLNLYSITFYIHTFMILFILFTLRIFISIKLTFK